MPDDTPTAPASEQQVVITYDDLLLGDEQALDLYMQVMGATPATPIPMPKAPTP